MKILSHNINGLNAYVKNGKLDKLFKDFQDVDIFCLQESKCNDLSKITNFFDKYADKYSIHVSCNNWKNGYAGVITVIKRGVLSGESYSGKIMNEYGEGRILYTNFPNFTLVNVYTLNSGNKEDLRKTWDKRFINYINGFKTPVIIVGDLNVCAGELDYHGNYIRSINSMPGLMDFEISGFQNLTHTCELIDSFRALHINDRKYSWYSNRNTTNDISKGWRLDYALVSELIASHIIDSEILPMYFGKDHSPIILTLDDDI